MDKKERFLESIQRVIKQIQKRVNTQPIDTRLHAANNIEDIERLLEAGVDINTKDKCGNTPLHYAAAQGNTDVMKLLLAKEAGINARNQKGQTPIEVAARSEQVASVKLLAKESVNLKDEKRYAHLCEYCYKEAKDPFIIVHLMLAGLKIEIDKIKDRNIQADVRKRYDETLTAACYKHAKSKLNTTQ